MRGKFESKKGVSTFRYGKMHIILNKYNKKYKPLSSGGGGKALMALPLRKEHFFAVSLYYMY